MLTPTNVAVSQIVFKIVQRCNLNCSYCYVYNRGDESWRSRPAMVRNDVISQLARRINEHCQRHSLERFAIELHGGEPLLIGREKFRAMVHTLRSTIVVPVDIFLQTNGLLLDRRWLELFDELEVTFGLSLDPPLGRSGRRVDHAGKDSTAKLLQIISELRHETELFERLNSGVLCVVDQSANGREVLQWLIENRFDVIDFLLPDGNYANPPQDWVGTGPYVRFMLDAFTHWYSLGSNAPRVRKFEEIIRSFMGRRSGLDSLGGDLRGLCVVESDGSIGLVDTVRFLGDNFAIDALNIFENSLDDRLEEYKVVDIQQVGETCRSCRYLRGCGGGYLPHRFDGVSFRNPSIYCDVLFQLCEKIAEVMTRDIPRDLWVPTPRPQDGASPYA